MAAVLTGLAGMLRFHVLATLAAVLAAIHALLLGGCALLMLGMRVRSGWRLCGQSGRQNKSHHVISPEFE
jgi:hypothetical protein